MEKVWIVVKVPYGVINISVHLPASQKKEKVMLRAFHKTDESVNLVLIVWFKEIYSDNDIDNVSPVTVIAGSSGDLYAAWLNCHDWLATNRTQAALQLVCCVLSLKDVCVWSIQGESCCLINCGWIASSDIHHLRKKKQELVMVLSDLLNKNNPSWCTQCAFVYIFVLSTKAICTLKLDEISGF